MDSLNAILVIKAFAMVIVVVTAWSYALRLRPLHKLVFYSIGAPAQLWLSLSIKWALEDIAIDRGTATLVELASALGLLSGLLMGLYGAIGWVRRATPEPVDNPPERADFSATHALNAQTQAREASNNALAQLASSELLCGSIPQRGCAGQEPVTADGPSGESHAYLGAREPQRRMRRRRLLPRFAARR